MKNLLIASLVALSSSAAVAQPKPVPVFREEVLPEGKGDWDTGSLSLMPDGTIERIDRKHGVETRATGRIDGKQVAAIKAELAASHWTVGHDMIHCMAIGVTFTRYSVDGKPVYDAHVCGDPLDNDSAKALADVRAIVEQAVPTSTAPTPPGPPTGLAQPSCTRSGGVLYEEESRPESRSSPMSTFQITVYDGGAWERVERDAKAKVIGQSNGCLDAAQRKTVRDALANKRWQITPNQATCDAVSAVFFIQRVHGKEVFRDRMCNSQGLDADSAKAIETVRTLVENVTAPHTPPCCKN